MPKKRTAAMSAQRGYTLIELLVVMVIIGLLASLVAPSMFSKVDSSKIKVAKAQMQMLGTSLDSYRLDTGHYPSQLSELIASNVKGWDGPYLKKTVPEDPWGNDYTYKVTASGYTLSSNGADGKVGGTGDGADIDGQ